jgi:adenylate cyclase
LSYVHLYRGLFGEAIDECARARADNPNDAEVLLHEGHLFACAGRAESGINRVEEALSLDPSHPNWFHHIHGVVAFEAERYETALAALNKYIELHQGRFVGLMGAALRVRAAANALSGRLDAARRDAANVLDLNPAFRVSAYVGSIPRQDPTSLERMTTALRLAGLPA